MDKNCFLPCMTLRGLAITFALLLMMLLSSCSYVAKKDGPPNFYVDVSKIPDAVPKPEPLAKYGNMSSYRVFGKRYDVMKSNKNYDQIGIASWYGTQFHQRNTSSGEPYDMLVMTAAHKTLPLPTYAEVTNLQNRRKIIVKINDRGPFAPNRLIDLSYVAAKKLGMIGRGTAYVRVRAIDPDTFGQQNFYIASRSEPYEGQAKNIQLAPTQSHQSAWQPSKHRKFVYLQVGAFRSKSNAMRLKQRLLTLLRAPVNISRPSAKVKLYRVQVGPIKDVAAANKITRRLRGLGIKPNKVLGA